MNHTWGGYSKIISLLYYNNIDEGKKLMEEVKTFKESVFSYCFMTEISHIPSKTHGKKIKRPAINGLIKERKSFFDNEFFNSFNIIIINSAEFMKNKSKKNVSYISKTFNVNYQSTEKFYNNEKNKDGERPFKFVDRYIGNNEKLLYVTPQLSGGAAWGYDGMEYLVNKIIKVDMQNKNIKL